MHTTPHITPQHNTSTTQYTAYQTTCTSDIHTTHTTPCSPHTHHTTYYTTHTTYHTSHLHLTIYIPQIALLHILRCATHTYIYHSTCTIPHIHAHTYTYTYTTTYTQNTTPPMHTYVSVFTTQSAHIYTHWGGGGTGKVWHGCWEVRVLVSLRKSSWVINRITGQVDFISNKIPVQEGS